MVNGVSDATTEVTIVAIQREHQILLPPSLLPGTVNLLVPNSLPFAPNSPA